MRIGRRRGLGLVSIAVLGLGLLGAACGEDPPPPPPPPATAAYCQSPTGQGAVVNAIYNRVNADRAANGLGPLAWDDRLACNAHDWAINMANARNLYHQDLNGVIHSAGYESYAGLGENILVGPGNMSADAMEDAWMHSDGHRANILGWYDSVGVSIAIGSDGRVWAVQEFGRHF